MQHSKILLSCSVALVLSLGAAMDASALDRARVFKSGPTNYCQGSLPVSDGKIRKRPLAVQNEGTTDAFVTCSFTTQFVNSGRDKVNEIQINAANFGGPNGTLSCTGVGGVQGQPNGNPFVVRSVQLLSAGAVSVLKWEESDFALGVFPAPFSISCNLKPGMALLDSSVFVTEDVGA